MRQANSPASASPRLASETLASSLAFAASRSCAGPQSLSDLWPSLFRAGPIGLPCHPPRHSPPLHTPGQKSEPRGPRAPLAGRRQTADQIASATMLMLARLGFRDLSADCRRQRCLTPSVSGRCSPLRDAAAHDLADSPARWLLCCVPFRDLKPAETGHSDPAGSTSLRAGLA